MTASYHILYWHNKLSAIAVFMLFFSRGAFANKLAKGGGDYDKPQLGQKLYFMNWLLIGAVILLFKISG